jgi:DNA topoisomerase-1
MTARTVDRSVSARDLRALVEKGRRAGWWRRSGSKSRGFRYETAAGEPITDPAALERIAGIVIPPAWRHVRISPSRNGKLQAVGVDARNRIQYRYHPAFASRQQRKKYEKIERFAARLPSLRRVTNEHLSVDGLTRERVLAVVVRLLDDLYFRVGSEKSARQYKTYGVTTLRNRHLKILSGGRLEFVFIGKHGIRHHKTLVDEELAALVKEIKSLGGARLFQYLDGDGKPHAVSPREVNEYIKQATSREFSAKDFRTWGATVLAAVTLAEMGAVADVQTARKSLVRAVKRVAEQLGNTPTVCRTCYIHPAVLEQYLAGSTIEDVRPGVVRRILRVQPEYTPEEVALLKLLGSNGSR